ncbi:MAG: hypothetical protein PHZ21_03405 [Candidatus Bipolaricaulis sp.]|nr:hypothetical protein [Candidatus Bipolaricaulis sp.]MDY0391945.1 hypothetical protein [Candidatus Bipolaricaulis sp.]
MPDESSHRWNWINAFLTAALNAAIAHSSRTPGQIPETLGEFITDYVKTVRSGLRPPYPAITRKPGELEYIFHLESELWGSDWKHYVRFFATEESRNCQPLQTFHFALAFFTIERCLALFLPDEKKKWGERGRASRRRDLFGREHGVFSVNCPHCLEAMGPPFFLCADGKQATAVGTATTVWSKLTQTPVPPELRQFYRATSRYEHFAPILEAAFVRTHASHLPKALNKDKKPLPPGTRAWWYDVLWRYSESIRYGHLVPTSEACESPFFWNRSIRWFTSLTITGLLTIAAAAEPSVAGIWESCRRKNPVLGGVFEGVARL